MRVSLGQGTEDVPPIVEKCCEFLEDNGLGFIFFLKNDFFSFLLDISITAYQISIFRSCCSFQSWNSVRIKVNFYSTTTPPIHFPSSIASGRYFPSCRKFIRRSREEKASRPRFALLDIKDGTHVLLQDFIIFCSMSNPLIIPNRNLT